MIISQSYSFEWKLRSATLNWNSVLPVGVDYPFLYLLTNPKLAFPVRYCIEHGSGIFLRTTTWTGSIPDIPSGETGTLWTGLIRFGVGLGVLSDLPWITVTINAPDADTIEETVFAKTFGAIVILQ